MGDSERRQIATAVTSPEEMVAAMPDRGQRKRWERVLASSGLNRAMMVATARDYDRSLIALYEVSTAPCYIVDPGDIAAALAERRESDS